MNGQNGELDILAILSVMLGVMNVQENRQQSAHNDVQRENDRQARYLLGEIARLFEGINRRLAEQDKTLAKIERILEEMRKHNEPR